MVLRPCVRYAREPGGICVSGKVYEEISGRFDLAFQDMGEQQLKNIAPGRARLATRPRLTGSSPTPKTIGIVVVADLAAKDEPPPPTAAITATRRRTKSVASAGSRSI